jgi:hypothetical protein
MSDASGEKVFGCKSDSSRGGSTRPAMRMQMRKKGTLKKKCGVMMSLLT